MGLITGILLVGARRGAKDAAREARYGNYLAKKHHKQIVAQNAALLRTQQAALHYQRYADDPTYRAATDEAAAAQRAALEAKWRREDKNRRRRINILVRSALLPLLAIGALVLAVTVWAPLAAWNRIGRHRDLPFLVAFRRAWRQATTVDFTRLRIRGSGSVW